MRRFIALRAQYCNSKKVQVHYHDDYDISDGYIEIPKEVAKNLTDSLIEKVAGRKIKKWECYFSTNSILYGVGLNCTVQAYFLKNIELEGIIRNIPRCNTTRDYDQIVNINYNKYGGFRSYNKNTKTREDWFKRQQPDLYKKLMYVKQNAIRW